MPSHLSPSLHNSLLKPAAHPTLQNPDPPIPQPLHQPTCREYCPQGTPVKVYRPCASVVTEHSAVLLRADSMSAPDTWPGGCEELQPTDTSSEDSSVTCMGVFFGGEGDIRCQGVHIGYSYRGKPFLSYRGKPFPEGQEPPSKHPMKYLCRLGCRHSTALFVWVVGGWRGLEMLQVAVMGDQCSNSPPTCWPPYLSLPPVSLSLLHPPTSKNTC